MSRLRYLCIGVAVLVIGLVVNIAPTRSAEKNLSPVESAVVKAQDEWAKAFQDRDLAKMDQLLTNEIDVFSTLLNGRFTEKKVFFEALKKKWGEGTAKMASYTVETTDRNFKFSEKGDEVTVTYTDTVRWSQPGGRVTSGTSVNKREQRLRKVGDDWKLFYQK